MKKFTAILMAVLMIAGLFVSCNNNAPVVDETVSVSFDESSSRSLTASLDTFDATKYYWAYKAVKTDSTGLNSGAIGFDWVKSEGTGLSGVTIPGFSQGAWEFTLYAYKIRNNEEANLAYSGVTNTILTKGADNTVHVTVNPASTGNGTLFVDIANIKLVNSLNNPITIQEGVTKVVEVKNLAGTESFSPKTGAGITDFTYDLAPAAYLVSVAYSNGDDILYASESVVATVYSNITTKVTGTVKEQTTSATFDPSINPDVMNKVAYSEAKIYDDIVKDIKLKEESPAGAKVTASVPKAAVGVAVKEVTGSDATGNEKVSMAVSVNTKSATSCSLNLEIGMTATVEYEKDGLVVSETKPVENFGTGNIITVEIALQRGLTNVKVTHKDDEMLPISESNSVGYLYNADTGILTIQTSSFSPFGISYDEPVYVAKVGSTSYTTLQGAVDAATSGSTIVLINNVVLNKTVTIDKGITLDLNGYSIHGDKVRALQIKEGTITISGIGTVSSDVANVGSSVIRVGDNDASSNAKLYIKEGVTVTTDTAYCITVFGSKYEYLYVYGKVISNAPENNSYDGCAIATLGTDDTQSTVKIYDGAEVRAENTNAIYMPSGFLTVDASETTTISGRTGIYVKSGSTTIKGGNIIGNGQDVEYNYYGNGGISTGDALVVDSCGYPNGKPSVSVTGGTFVSVNAKAVRSYNTEGNDRVIGFIKGGTYNTEPNDELFNKPTYKAEYSNGLWITHKHDWQPDENNLHKFADKTCESAEKYYKKCSTCDAYSYDPSIYYTVGDALGHEIDFDTNDNFCDRCNTTFPILKKTVQSDGTTTTSGLTSLPGTFKASGKYKVFEDIQSGRTCIGGALYINMNIEIDLGGHILTSKGSDPYSGFYFHPSSSGNTVTFKNGTIKESADSTSSALISIKGSSNNKMIFDSTLTIECVNDTTTAVLVESDGKLESSATIKAKDTTIMTNGSTTNKSASISINGGSVKSENAAAIYLPAGTLNITGGTIEGNTGVYIKSGITTISGGTIVATGDKNDYVYNGGGYNLTGNALVVDNCGYPGGVPEVTIIGGTLEGKKNNAVGSYSNGEGNNAVTIDTSKATVKNPQ